MITTQSAYESELTASTRLAIATLVGLGVGIERQWSGHASGPHGRFAGMRTFALLGVIGGGAGLLAEWGHEALAVTLLATGAAFAVSAYVAAVRRPDADLDGTTEGAAIVVLTLGALAGIGSTMLAAGAGALVVLALGEKARLHQLVSRIGQPEMRAALQFSVLALVILPLLPAGPYGPFGGIRPRSLWALVLVLSGINFVAYVARHAVGAARGYAATGALGGIVSSTAVTLEFSRLSRREPAHAGALALGVVTACTVLPLRIAAFSAALDLEVAGALLWYLLPVTLVGAAIVALALRRVPAAAVTVPTGQSPLRLWSAVQMAVLFQLSLTVLAAVRAKFGSTGVIATAVGLGLTDMDALTLSMIRLNQDAGAQALAALGIGVGLLTNTLFKLMVALALGAPAFRRRVAVGLAVLAVTIGTSIWLAAVV